ncbi:hypothetical protein [Prevotella intermedia]|uniref:hypothetical protein n=1 Tax=Prevotella intermedia TaxID=28131 RepID=UPI000BE72846|nr:hypothetical protein [Prevotella intermedia]PDP83529.1 hypothetical protein CLI69_01305 [Prevotella intermedia]
MKKSIFHYALSALFVGAAALSAASCADDDINPSGGTDGDALVRFSINDVQEQAVSRGLEMTRGAIATGLSNADLAGGRLEAHNNAGLDVCLIETTVEGVNPIKADARTRADIIKTATLGDFSSTGIRGTSATSILSTPEWFKAQKTKSNGELYSPIRWAFSQPYARFFAVHPAKENYSKMTINDMAAADIAPSVDFEVEPNVRDQKDFMTACTGDVHYATRGVHPTTNLDFRHALTGIRFAVGQNLSYNLTIKKVEIQNAIMKSKYTLSKEFNGTGAAWDHSSAAHGTATLDGLNVATNTNPNVTIMGNDGDNFTFYMIPQMLTGKGIHARIECKDHNNSDVVIDVVLKGEWKAGTTRTYKLSQTNSTWNYVLTATDPSRAAKYDETASQPYGITSYRQAPDGTRQAVPWKVIGYDADNDGTFTMAEKPAWLTALSSESGSGGTSAEAGTATLTKDVKDLLKERNDGLKNATALGSSSAPYDLSTKGGSESRSTANSYLISAPGHYRIPLVYGNAIKNGATNSNAYETTATGTYVLQHFKDHNNQNITDPWIEKSNAANAGIDGAKIVWADEQDLVHLSASPIKQDGGNAYLDFEVKQADIKSGNAVVAVTKNGTVLWSWHLWFAPKDALDKITVTNHQNKNYDFTKEALGWKPIQWSGSTYSSARTVKVKVEQTVANNGTKQEAVINITQNPGSVKKGATTLYQFGRKDAFPGVDKSKLATNSHFTENAGDNMSIMNGIQHPDFYYTGGSNWNSNYGYYNLWSADNTVTGGWNVGNDNPVVKTVYDPSPVGFKMPANNAFTGFTANGQNEGTMNVDGTDVGQTFSNNFGHNFWTSSSKTATINFPASGFRFSNGGALNDVGGSGYYWLAVPNGLSNGCDLFFHSYNVRPLSNDARSFGFSVRPVSE